MLPIIGGIAVAAGVAAWIFNQLTDEEKEKQERLKKKLDKVKDEYYSEIDRYNKRMNRIVIEQFYELREKYLDEINFYRDEKEGIIDDLDKLFYTIEKELENESISPYQKQSLLNIKNRVESAKNRLDAYWNYLDWYENKLYELETFRKYKEIFNLEIPQPLLPEDYLYVGKVAYITKNEIGTSKTPISQGWNRYNQRLGLQDYLNKKELEIWESFDDEEEFIVLIDYVKAKLDKYYFKASIIKGELYRYILEDMSFEVQPIKNERENQEILKVAYKDICLKLKREDKLYQLKRYKESDSFEVKVKSHDLLLKDVFVTEKIYRNTQEISTNPIFLIIDDLLIDKVETKEVENSLKNYPFEVVDLKQDSLSLKIGDFLFFTKIDKDEKVLVLKDIYKVDIDKIDTKSITIPYTLQIEEKDVYEKMYKKLSIGRESTFDEFILFLNEQFNYMNYSSKTFNQDFEFFKKWERIIDYQIENNTFIEKDISYNRFEKDIDKKVVTFYVDDLKDYVCYFKDKKSSEIFVETKGINLGYLDDFSLEDGILKVKVDFIDELDIQESGSLLLKIKTFQGVFQKQKKALRDFSLSNIVNQELKPILISPHLINYKPIKDDVKLEFKNKHLTQNQKEVITKAFNEKNIFIIQGPPGTGKTTTIKEIIYQTIKHDRYAKILVVSQQNVAVDNVLNGVYQENRDLFEQEGHSLVRVAPNENKIQYDEIKELTIEKWFENYKEMFKNNFIQLELNSYNDDYHKKLYEFAKEWINLIYKDDFKDIDNELKELLISKHQILGATCVGFANKSLGLDLVEFDLAIIDEAGRATAPELLIPILRAKKVILIGDQNQLPPAVDKSLREKMEKDDEDELSSEDLELLEKSFFEKLFEETSDSNKDMLVEQFRMPKEIGDLISELFYNNRLKNGHIKDSSNFLYPENIVQWIDVKGEHNYDGTSSYNEKEIEEIIRLIQEIDKKAKDKKVKKTVGVITPYAAQKRRIRKRVKSINLSNISHLKVDTVDSFQGEEADIIIYSTVKTYGNISFLIDRKRLNVAISRTKENLIFVGDKNFFYNAKAKNKEVNLFKQIIDFIKQYEKS